MGVERGGTGGAKFIFREQRREFLVFRLPISGRTENLREAAPTDVTDQRGFFLVRGNPVLGLEFANQPDGREVGTAFILERTFADAIGLGDAIIILIAGYAVSSGVNKMYSCLTISQA
jgi:hypothetical protein